MTEHDSDGAEGAPNPWSARAQQVPFSQTPPPAQTPPEQVPPPAHTTSEQVLFGTAFSGGGSTHGYQSGPPLPPPIMPPPVRIPEQHAPEPPRRGGLVVGMTVLALIVGGAAGSVGGYLVANHETSASAPANTALDAPKPIKQTTAAPPGSVESAADKVLPSVVQLQVQNGSVAGEGSGIVISSDGMIVTNNHVVADAAQGGQIVAVFQNGKAAKATIVGRDPDSDIAVVKAQGVGGLTVADIGRSDDLRIGQGVVAIGSPFDLQGTVTSGIVSSLHRPTRAGGEQGDQNTVLDAIQTDASINPGNSGGPLADLQGRVVGINSAIYSPSTGNGNAGSVGIGFAIPIDQARRTADEIVKTGKATQTVLGVRVQDNQGGAGAKIIEITQDGAAQKAGLQVGDVVTQMDDRRIDSSDALVAAVRSHAPGDKVKLVLDSGSRSVEVTLAGQPVRVN